jgi:hypothetical protein
MDHKQTQGTSELISGSDSNYTRPLLPTRYTLRKSLWFNLPVTAYFVLAMFQPSFPFRWIFELLGGYWIYAVTALFLLNCLAIIICSCSSKESRSGLPIALFVGFV